MRTFLIQKKIDHYFQYMKEKNDHLVVVYYNDEKNKLLLPDNKLLQAEIILISFLVTEKEDLIVLQYNDKNSLTFSWNDEQQKQKFLSLLSQNNYIFLKI